MDDFIAWFQHHGGVLDTSIMGIADFPGSGRGAIALKDILVCASPLQIDQHCGLLNGSFAFHRKAARFSRFLAH